MIPYGPRELADSFRTVRKNTIAIAHDIPDDRYSFKAAPEVMSVAQMLAHIAVSTHWVIPANGPDRKSHVEFADFMASMELARKAEAALTTKAQILEALERDGNGFASFLEQTTPELLSEVVTFPPPVTPSTKSRFELILGVKEHEMHHRGQLMLVERLLGIVPHLTRQRQERQSGAAAS